MKYVLAAAFLLLVGGGYIAWQGRLGIPVATNSESQQLQNINPAQNVDASIPSAETYSFSQLPQGWRTESRLKTGNVTFRQVFVFDEKNALVMKLSWPVLETGYEDTSSVERGTLRTSFADIEKSVRVSSVDSTLGFAWYLWDGGEDFWERSFEIFVYFGDKRYDGFTHRYKNYEAFKIEQVYIENIIATSLQAN